MAKGGALAALVALLLVLAPDQAAVPVQATNPVGLRPLLTCGNVNGDSSGAVAGPDFFALLGKFGLTSSSPGFSYVYDLNTPPDSSVAGTDFFVLLGDFGQTCPAVDTEIAQATLAVLNDPLMSQVITNCNETTMDAIGYDQISFDVPGQGIHYANFSYWSDGVLTITQPEGLVCQNGRLAAELYVVNGDVTGWGPFTPGGPVMHSIDIDAFCTTTPCSWATSEGWHAHSNLCIYHAGTTSANNTYTTDLAACQAANGGGPGYAYWDAGMGWMGHLWNFQLNPNLVDENGDTTPDHGRFADCGPPAKAENCPM